VVAYRYAGTRFSRNDGGGEAALQLSQASGGELHWPRAPGRIQSAVRRSVRFTISFRTLGFAS